MTAYFTDASCNLADFAAMTARRLTADEVPFAADLMKYIPVYDMAQLADVLDDPAKRPDLRGEWAWVLGQSAGTLVLWRAYADTSAIDRATKIFTDIIAAEKQLAQGGGDHFAAAGANDRIWNAPQKLCLTDPETYTSYTANPAIAAVCEAIYPALVRANLTTLERDAVIAATAEGYPFPTNLDTDPPTGGMAPASMADHLCAALDTGEDLGALRQRLQDLTQRQTAW